MQSSALGSAGDLGLAAVRIISPMGIFEGNPIPLSHGNVGRFVLSCSLRKAHSRAEHTKILEGKSSGAWMQGKQGNSKLLGIFSPPSVGLAAPGQAGAAPLWQELWGQQ